MSLRDYSQFSPELASELKAYDEKILHESGGTCVKCGTYDVLESCFICKKKICRLKCCRYVSKSIARIQWCPDCYKGE